MLEGGLYRLMTILIFPRPKRKSPLQSTTVFAALSRLLLQEGKLTNEARRTKALSRERVVVHLIQIIFLDGFWEEILTWDGTISKVVLTLVKLAFLHRSGT